MAKQLVKKIIHKNLRKNMSNERRRRASKKCQIAWPSQVVVNFCLYKKTKESQQQRKSQKIPPVEMLYEQVKHLLKLNTLRILKSIILISHFISLQTKVI